MIKISVVKKISYVYLLLPIFIFGAGWLNIFAQVFFIPVVIIGLVFIWKQENSSGEVFFSKSDTGLSLILLSVWVVLSGIGGYAFQNWDHHSREAVFRDLINLSWPTVYHLDPSVASQFHAPANLILSYYFGFWLPAALVGKVSGWDAANLILLLWSLGGILLCVLLTTIRLQLSLLKTTLLIIFFSGMDIVGVWLLRNVPGYTYPGIWPPIQHLEWWAGSFQYSSFTSGLYWTYNQFIPTMLVLSLFVNMKNGRNSILLISVCSFFAPLPAVGLMPFAIGNIIQDFVLFWRGDRKKIAFHMFEHACTFESLSGILIGVISLLFFSTNLSAQSRHFVIPQPFILYLLFLLLEGFLLWLFLLPMYRKEWSWYIAGVILVAAPLIRIGSSWDFMLRTTLPSLYYLLVGCGLFLANVNGRKLQLLIMSLFLCAGAMTPIYEVARSMVRTDRYYGYHVFSSTYFERYFHNPPDSNQLFVPEYDHLNTLIADEWKSVSIPNTVGWDTKVGRLFQPKYEFLWKPRLIISEPP